MDTTGADLSRCHDELERSAHRAVGAVVFAFSRLEFSLTMALRNLVGGATPFLADCVVERLQFKAKLDALLEVVDRRFSADHDFILRFRSWHKRADDLRVVRNSFIHGRWGIAPSSGEVVNVAPGIPGESPQFERRLTESALREHEADVTALLQDFYALTQQWPK